MVKRPTKRNIVTFELLDQDQDIAQVLAKLPGHVTKSGLIRLALRTYLGGQVPAEELTGASGEGDVVKINHLEVSDEELDGLFDNALSGF